MKVSILDDYFDTFRTLDCFKKLAGHEVKVWNDHVKDVDALAERLRDTEERSGADEIDRLAGQHQPRTAGPVLVGSECPLPG